MRGGSRKQELAAELQRVRTRTLWLLERVPPGCWNERVHDFYSPVGWHFGHIGMTEEYWTCVRAMGGSPRDAHLSFLYANIPENPKANRVHVPAPGEAAAYLAATRRDALAELERADLASTDPLLACGYAWEFALQHECQHQETIVELLQLIQQALLRSATVGAHTASPPGERAAEDYAADVFISVPSVSRRPAQGGEIPAAGTAASPSGGRAAGGHTAKEFIPSPPGDGARAPAAECLATAPRPAPAGPMCGVAVNFPHPRAAARRPPEAIPVDRSGAIANGKVDALSGGRRRLAPRSGEDAMISIPGGSFVMGSDEPFGYDNEKRAHRVDVAPFELDGRPVTVGEWRAFIEAGGYETCDIWHTDGWKWRNQHDICRPEYWIASAGDHLYCSAEGARDLDPFEPVSAISWYEADAYARWAGKRLPTEAEWEYAAASEPVTGEIRRIAWGGCGDPAEVDCEMRAWRPSPVREDSSPSPFGVRGMAGGVWEWTASPFLPYPGFEPFPYDGYSKEHMDGRHFVCRGGSWATDRRILRPSFRNWYVPSYRQGFMGMRCAR